MKDGTFLKILSCLILALCLSIFFPVSSPAQQGGKLSSPEDLNDKRIAVLQGSTHEIYATQHYPKATILQYKTVSDMLLAITTGKADAAIYSRDELVEYIRTSDELGFVGEALYRTPIAIAFHQQDTGLRLSFNRFLQQIKQDGSYDDMLKRWMQQGTTEMPKLNATGTGKPLMVGILSDNGLPFSVMKDNRLVGFNIELMERFGSFSNRSVQYVDLEFGSQIAALAGQKIDMIAAPMAITEERKKKVAFADPYYTIDSHAFALKKNILASTGSTARPPSFLTSLITGFQSNLIHENRYLLILDGLKTTIIISLFATLFGTLLGALICAMRMSPRRRYSMPARVYIALLRGIPVLVVLMLIFYVVFASVHISPVIVAIIAFGLNFAAYAAEIFRSGIQSIDKGQAEAGIALGFSRVRTFQYIVLPQMVRRVLPVYKGEFISLVKMTSIVGYIAVQDLTKAGDIIRSRTFDAFFPLVMVAILYFLIAWVLMQALEYLERSIDPTHRGPAVHGQS